MHEVYERQTNVIFWGAIYRYASKTVYAVFTVYNQVLMLVK